MSNSFKVDLYDRKQLEIKEYNRKPTKYRAAAIPLLNRHRFLFFPLSPFLPQGILTPFAFVGLFAFFFLNNCGLDFSWSGDQSSSNCEEIPLERLGGASLVHAN
ncbi:hypothetical protein N7517_001850 [Penicillium concentricum]|uniref:Transmembrane protein n=1 Tax=Penicillium concentricum TaxID=293559 RepID=A0A9W9SUA6_9EURO|nr:uncharacterized protein N7517_001850 [Penicillium concentricum]KAJ5383939.1 hypothetical protein N7517_001850 [Penicillium concentricum]